MADEYELPSVPVGMDTIWVAINTFLIFFMQLGFSFVEAGAVRYKNIHSILMKNTLDVCIGTVTFWLVGYSFAFGETNGGFIGSSEELYAGKGFSDSNSYLHWMNQWAFASTATTIISGAVAERLKISGYMIFCIIMTMFIYPIQVHWVWGTGGWLADDDFKDFAGVNAVHMVGGIAGLVATIIIGPRLGRFEPKRASEFKPSSIPYIVLGTILLWFCWYGFNCGTVVGFGDDLAGTSKLVGLVGMNTTLGAVGGALSCYFLGQIIDKRIDYNDGTNNLCMGILAGLVSITGCCNNIEPWAAFVCGIIGGLVYVGYSRGIKKIKIDDPLDASSIHFAVGVWGGIATGFFEKDNGVFYGGDQIGIQLLGILTICVWTAGLSLIILLILKKLDILRCSDQVEEIGFDNIYRDEEEDNLLFQAIKYLQSNGTIGPDTLNNKAVARKISDMIEHSNRQVQPEKVLQQEKSDDIEKRIEMTDANGIATEQPIKNEMDGSLKNKQPHPA